MTGVYPRRHPRSPLDPLFFVAFDQRIDPAAVLETIQVSASGQAVILNLARKNEVKANDEVSGLVKNTPGGPLAGFSRQPTPAAGYRPFR